MNGTLGETLENLVHNLLDELKVTDAEVESILRTADEIAGMGADPTDWVNANARLVLEGIRDTGETDIPCPDDKFDLRQFTKHFDYHAPPIVSQNVKANLWRLYNTILRPLVDHYKSTMPELEGLCVLNIINGVASGVPVRSVIAGSGFSTHFTGEGVDFNIMGVEETKIIDDIINGVIPIQFGVLAHINGIHITLPLSFEGYAIENLYIRTLDGSRERITHRFIS